MTLKEKILEELRSTPGLTDRELTDRILGEGIGQQAVNQAARALAVAGQIVRSRRTDGKIGNYLNDGIKVVEPPREQENSLPEDEVKRKLEVWLKSFGWQVCTAWGGCHGIDVDAKLNGQRWIIEVKGCGSLNPMRVNYFLGVLGELLQRMDDPDAKYSIALPDMEQYRRLWQRLPELAKSRTTVSARFVNSEGRIEEVSSQPRFDSPCFPGLASSGSRAATCGESCSSCSNEKRLATCQRGPGHALRARVS